MCSVPTGQSGSIPTRDQRWCRIFHTPAYLPRRTTTEVVSFHQSHLYKCLLGRLYQMLAVFELLLMLLTGVTRTLLQTSTGPFVWTGRWICACQAKLPKMLPHSQIIQRPGATSARPSELSKPAYASPSSVSATIPRSSPSSSKVFCGTLYNLTSQISKHTMNGLSWFLT